MSRRGALAPLALALLAPATAPAIERTEERAPCAASDPLRRPFFGDLHVHTRYSLDASTQGTRTRPSEAYAFAKGAPLGLQPFSASGEPGRTVQLARPLDFAAVTDHSELFGEVDLCNTPGSPGYDSTVCLIYRGWPRIAFFFMNARGAPRFSFCGEGGRDCLVAASTPWREMQEAAEAAYDRSSACRFTSFVGYEWTKSVQTASNLHRNVIFRNAAVPALPASAVDATTPEDLWDALDRECRAKMPGCQALVIPHNSNLSSGFMFAPEQLRNGQPFTAEYARRRADNERLVEVIQHKGDSECRLGAGTNDELCTNELLPYDSFAGRFNPIARHAPAALNFTRTALGAGLVHQVQLGVNPFQFGLIGSTDTHIGAAGLVEEKGHPGHGGAGLPIGDTLPDSLLDPIEYSPGGLAGVWAEENSRDALFEAMMRRETFATSGPRIAFRSFAGYGLDAGMCGSDFAKRGYAEGVAMGGELAAPPSADAAPAIAAWALQDPGTAETPGVPLQRLQIIKLWVADGIARESVVDVAGDPKNGARVDEQTCEPIGAGAPQLCAVWRDPDFDPRAPALYYARVVQNPTCRWSTYACNAAGVRCGDSSTIRPGYEACCDAAYPRTIQERAWTSPVWYTPQ
ncbi:MAG TPA: DUF3604 domain-containing protein [Myxococcota bacterium]|nr:DUF3604 domain-containing protein [Myxococcota bacterium]